MALNWGRLYAGPGSGDVDSRQICI